MQHPVGYMVENGRALMNDFGALLANQYVWYQFPHTVLSGFTTAAFFVIGISVYHLLRKKDEDLFRRSFNLATIFGMISISLVILVGHNQAQEMVQVQPMKMAAVEALWETESPASFSLFTVGDEANLKDRFAFRIPYLLSILAYNQPSGEVKGIRNLQAEYEQQYGPGYYVPSVFTTYWTFRIMVGVGFLMFAVMVFALYHTLRERPLKGKLAALLPLAIGLPYLANSAGWILTEMGRQPWIVYGLMKTESGFSPNLTPGLVLASLITFTLVYALLMVADIYLLSKYAKAGPAATDDQAGNASQPAIDGQAV
jgi:cytochrome d ubiquinol oxidase subunit I